MTKTDPRTARLCPECNNLITTDAACPLCDAATLPAPKAIGMTESYCQGCGGGPFPVAQLHLLTWNEDPYLQFEDGDLACICGPCQKQRKEESE